MKVYLCLGSNLGDSRQLVNQALGLIGLLPESQLLRKSSLIETQPYGNVYQPVFWNQVAELETGLKPHDLLHRLQEFEAKMGRVRTIKWGPRLIDLDILFYGKKILNDHDLVLPHPDLQHREFALRLLRELIPSFKHPILNKTIAELYKELQQKETK